MIQYFIDLSVQSETSDLKQGVNESTVQVGQNVGANMDVFGLLTSLILVLVIIFVAAYILKRFNVAPINNQHIKLVSSMSLGPKEKLVIVEIGEEQWVLGVTGQQVNLIDKLATPVKSHQKQELSPDFSQSILNILKKSS